MGLIRLGGERWLFFSSVSETCCTPPDEQKLPVSNCSRLRVPKALAIGSAMSLSTIAKNAATQAF